MSIYYIHVFHYFLSIYLCKQSVCAASLRYKYNMGMSYAGKMTPYNTILKGRKTVPTMRGKLLEEKKCHLRINESSVSYRIDHLR